jgi:AraC-like DNA-binding protein
MAGRSGNPRWNDAQACVGRALEAARAALALEPAAAIGLVELAGAAGVSPRTLQRHFARIVKLSPRRAIERLRLAGARQTLCANEVESVLAASSRHGFEHPGRFAIAYARAFGERPSVTLRAARARPAAAQTVSGTPVVLQALAATDPQDAARARRATDDLAMTLASARNMVLLTPLAGTRQRGGGALELSGRVEAGCVILSLVRPASGIVLRVLREPLAVRGGRGWAARATEAVCAAIAAEQLARSRCTPRYRSDVETLITRARPAALSQEPALIGMALDLVGEALHRDPTHARAHALAGWSRAVGANHCFTRDAEGERAHATEHARQALELGLDDPDVLTLVAGVMSLTHRLDEAECLVKRSLLLDPDQPEALRRLGFIENFRGRGRLAAAAFRRALAAYPNGNDGTMSLIGLGVASFIVADYPRSCRALSRALSLQPSRVWPYRFLTAAAMHAGAREEAQRSLAPLRRCFPDLTVDRCAQSGVLQPEALGRVLDGLARAGLPN